MFEWKMREEWLNSKDVYPWLVHPSFYSWLGLFGFLQHTKNDGILPLDPSKVLCSLKILRQPMQTFPVIWKQPHKRYKMVCTKSIGPIFFYLGKLIMRGLESSGGEV